VKITKGQLSLNGMPICALILFPAARTIGTEIACVFGVFCRLPTGHRQEQLLFPSPISPARFSTHLTRVIEALTGSSLPLLEANLRHPQHFKVVHNYIIKYERALLMQQNVNQKAADGSAK
jgi:hypothetical protein